MPAGAAWASLGTTVEVRVADERALATVRAVAERELAAIDASASRFRRDSELSRANAAAGRPVPASPLFLDALELALRGAELTDGDVDPTIGRALELAGYDRDWRELEPAGDARPVASAAGSRAPLRVAARALPGWQALVVDRARRRVTVPRGVCLDLGSCAKALCADRIAAAGAAAAGCGVIAAVGGDLAVAGRTPAGGWEVRVTDDHRAGASAPGQTVFVQAGGLATSSVAARRWRHGGRTMHHVLDPRSGEPVAGPWRTVSVAAASCADANIAATAALVRGEAAAAWLAARRLPARLVRHGGEVEYVAGWLEGHGARDALVA
jgi:FAD:protein FMN transferase